MLLKQSIAITLLLISFSVLSQTNSGIVTYQETIYTKPDLQKAEEQGWAEWASMVPDSVNFNKVLLFSEAASSYKTLPMEGDPEEGNMIKRMMRRYANPNNMTYRNVTENKFVEQKDFMGKTFLIKGEPEELKWKMTGEMKVIVDQPCLKATYEDSTGVIEAWFATQIPISIGPENYGQLPGLILELYVKKEKKRLTATKIEFKEIDSSEFIEPTEGKEVTREKFHKIMREKFEEMKRNGGSFGGGHGRH